MWIKERLVIIIWFPNSRLVETKKIWHIFYPSSCKVNPYSKEFLMSFIFINKFYHTFLWNYKFISIELVLLIRIRIYIAPRISAVLVTVNDHLGKAHVFVLEPLNAILRPVHVYENEICYIYQFNIQQNEIIKFSA